MQELSGQEKIIFRLLGYANDEVRFGQTSDGQFSINESTKVGEIIQTMKDWLEQRRWLAKIKHIPILGTLCQAGYLFITRPKVMIDVTEILKLDGVLFISTLYRVVLHREPDNEGMRNVLQMLAMGTDKRQLFCDLWNSSEALALGKRSVVSDVELTKYKVKRALKSFGYISLPLKYLYKIWKLPKRFYAMAPSVRLLLNRVDALEGRIQLLETVINEQRKKERCN